MKETMRKCKEKINITVGQLKHTYKAAQIYCENTVYRYKYRIFFKGYRGLLEELPRVEVRLPQIKNKINQGFKTILEKAALVYSKAAFWRRTGVNSKK